MSRKRRPPEERPPMDRDAAERLALFYVGRYATTRARLRSYLARKLRERGADGPVDVDAIVERIAALGYVDDAGFARSRAAALGRRGFGVRRVTDTLRAAGIEEDDRHEAVADLSAAETAIAFARRKRIGPFATEKAPPDAERKLFAAFARAGHGFAIAKRLIDSEPGDMSLVQELLQDG
ncbi:regulatory protein [Sphingomonas jejuensis]|uniref:Regulatory protein n=1 Tax=Sphingomonas jejuensis TaxID=904715 RepID=A0ABX0XMB6_9SPHN|nr:RecX family transcriptional regulator [Sphingomonas jejuensis]NJC33831.1 regulatory protein [Sphingomonas jejuensis]